MRTRRYFRGNDCDAWGEIPQHAWGDRAWMRRVRTAHWYLVHSFQSLKSVGGRRAAQRLARRDRFRAGEDVWEFAQSVIIREGAIWPTHLW